MRVTTSPRHRRRSSPSAPTCSNSCSGTPWRTRPRTAGVRSERASAVEPSSRRTFSSPTSSVPTPRRNTHPRSAPLALASPRTRRTRRPRTGFAQMTFARVFSRAVSRLFARSHRVRARHRRRGRRGFAAVAATWRSTRSRTRARGARTRAMDDEVVSRALELGSRATRVSGVGLRSPTRRGGGVTLYGVDVLRVP